MNWRTLSSMSPEQRFWRNVRRGDPGECWEWQGELDKDGYGNFRYRIPGKRFKFRAHRFAYAIGKPLSDGHLVRHKCDNARCVNPSHLEPGTVADNHRDMVTRGRSLKGEKQHKSKLTTSDVVMIRMLHSDGASPARLASMFGVTTTNVRYVVKGATWSHVGPFGEMFADTERPPR